MKKFLTISLVMFCAFVSAQELQTYEYQRLRIGVEAGFENLFGSNVKPAAIRESQSFYYGDYYHGDYYYGCGYLYEEPSFRRYYVGVKPEYSLNHHFTVAAGLRFSFGSSTLTSNREYFLWKVMDTETASNYLRIKDISQTAYNIGVPLEMKIFISRGDLIVRQYFKIGASLNFAFTDAVAVNFIDPKMNKYAADIKNQFENPDFFNGQAILGFGFKIGRMRNPFGSIEIQMPIHFSQKTRLNSLFQTTNPVGVGFQANIYIPYEKQKLSYQYRPR